MAEITLTLHLHPEHGRSIAKSLRKVASNPSSCNEQDMSHFAYCANLVDEIAAELDKANHS